MTRTCTCLPRGVAALTVVMVLFFVMAMVAAYANRNLVFEQRISANSYRATRALEAADAGVEWTIAMLNSGRTTANCTRPALGAEAGLSDFRSRYLVATQAPTSVDGGFGLAWGLSSNRAYPACITVDGVLRCICPALGQAPADIGAPADGIGSAFRITFGLFNGNAVRPGAIQLESQGCANPGTGSLSCFAQTNTKPNVDGTVKVIASLGLVSALPRTPEATLTVGEDIDGTGMLLLGASNGVPGLAAQAGGAVSALPGSVVRDISTASGMDINAAKAQNLVVQGAKDHTGLAWSAGLLSAQGKAEQRWFRSVFALDLENYKYQPATQRLDCTAGCNGTSIANAWRLNPHNPIWADGNVNLDLAGGLGTVAEPVMLIVNGTLTVSADLRATGFVHAGSIAWPAADAWWDGAVVTSGRFSVTGNAELKYRRDVLDKIRLQYGSFVRIPGGWNLL